MQTGVSSWDTMKCASSARDLAEHYLPLSHNFLHHVSHILNEIRAHVAPKRQFVDKNTPRGNLLITTDLKIVSMVPWRLCCHLPICLP